MFVCDASLRADADYRADDRVIIVHTELSPGSTKQGRLCPIFSEIRQVDPSLLRPNPRVGEYSAKGAEESLVTGIKEILKKVININDVCLSRSALKRREREK